MGGRGLVRRLRLGASPLQPPALLCSLYGLAAYGLHAESPAWLPSLIFAAAMVASALTTYGSKPPAATAAARWQLISAVFALIIGIVWAFGLLFSSEALALICAFILLQRWALGREPSHYRQIWILSSLLMLTGCLHGRGIGILLLLLGWMVSTLQLLNLQAIHGSSSARQTNPYLVAPQSLRSAFKHLPLVMVISLVLLFVIPRTADRRPASPGAAPYSNRSAVHQVAYSGTVGFHKTPRLVEDNTIAFRIIDPPSTLIPQLARFRVSVVDLFDGWEWTSSPRDSTILSSSDGAVSIRRPDESLGPRMVHYTIQLADFRDAGIPATNRAVSLSRLPKDVAVAANDDGTWSFRGARLPGSWVVTSQPELAARRVDRPGPSTLQLPEPLEIPARTLAIRLMAGTRAMPVELKVQQAAAQLRRHGVYTLDLTHLAAGPEGLSRMMMEDLRGNCEYFATALALVLRAEGIHSRLVLGFRGGVYGEKSSQSASRPDLLILNRHAHSWVEAWDPVAGNWVEVDPTPMDGLASGEGSATAPGRLQTSLAEIKHLGSVIDSFDGRAQRTFWLGWLDSLRHRAVSFEAGLLVRAAERILQRVEEPVLQFFACALLLLNVALWCVMRRLRRRPVGTSPQPSTAAANWYDASPLLARLALHVSPPPTVDPARFIREAAVKLGGSGADAETLVSLYWEWRYAESAPGHKLVVESRFRQLVGDLAICSQSSRGIS